MTAPPTLSWALPLDPSSLRDPPPALAREPQNFSSFNPSLLPGRSAGDPLSVFFRVSNMHFCRCGAFVRDTWRDSVRAQHHITSYLAAVDLEPTTLEVLSPPTVLRRATELFRTEGSSCDRGLLPGLDGVHATFSGPEDPRPIWSPGPPPRAPWLLASVWSERCDRLRVHLIKLAPKGGAGKWGRRSATQVPLVVDGWFGALEWPKEWAPHRHPEEVPMQKNWLPFVRGGELLVEYSLEPHVVLRVDASTGRCAPGGGARPPSFGPLRALSDAHGLVSGGAPPVLIRSGPSGHPLFFPEGEVYVGIAHYKAGASELLGSARMAYRHLFYAFSASPPFAMSAISDPFVLPQPNATELGDGGSGCDGGEAGGAPTVQFASGLVLDPAGTHLLVGYSALDCGARVSRFPLADMLRGMMILW